MRSDWLLICFLLGISAALSAQTDSLVVFSKPFSTDFDLNLLVGDWWWAKMVNGKIMPVDTGGAWVQIETKADPTARYDFMWHDYGHMFDPETFEEIRDVRGIETRFLRFQPSYRVLFWEESGKRWEKLVYLDKNMVVFRNRFKQKEDSYSYLVSKFAK